jgi:hypothetical protein
MKPEATKCKMTNSTLFLRITYYELEIAGPHSSADGHIM